MKPIDFKKEREILGRLLNQVFGRYNWKDDKCSALEDKNFRMICGKNTDEELWYNRNTRLLFLLNWIDDIGYAYLRIDFKISSKLMKLEELFNDNYSSDSGINMEIVSNSLKNEYKTLYLNLDKIWIAKSFPYKLLFIINKSNNDIEYFLLLNVFDLDGTIEEIKQTNNNLENIEKIDKWI